MAGDAQAFFGLGDLPGGFRRSEALAVSRDGTTVVGKSSSAASGNHYYEAFRWRLSEGMIGLGVVPGPQPNSEATATSPDGEIAVGTVYTPQGSRAFRWRQQAGMALLARLVNGLGATAYGVSADGNIIVGAADTTGGRFEAVVWNANGDITSLTPGTSGGAADVTPDGQVIVGSSSTVGGFRWTQTTGLVSIGLSPWSTVPYPAAVNADGSVIVGSFDLGGVSRAFRWTQQTGIVSLDHLDVGEDAVAHAVSGDGRIIVGVSGVRAFIWDDRHGMRDLRRVLTRDYGLDLSQWGLDTATGISADGTVIVGKGAGPRGPEAYMVVIPEPGALGGLIGGLGILAVSVRRRR